MRLALRGSFGIGRYRRWLAIDAVVKVQKDLEMIGASVGRAGVNRPDDLTRSAAAEAQLIGVEAALLVLDGMAR